MDAIPVDGELVSKTSGTVANALTGEPEETEIRAYHNSERSVLLIERRKSHANLVATFDILDDSTVRSRVPTHWHTELVLRAVVALGFETVKAPYR